MNKMYIEDTKKAIIKEQIKDLNDNDIISIYTEITGEYVYNDLEQMLDELNISAYDAICKFHFGDCNFSDEIWTFDGYDNFKSYYNAESFAEGVAGYLETDYLDEVVDNYEDYFDLDLLRELEDMDQRETGYLELKEEQEKESNAFISECI